MIAPLDENGVVLPGFGPYSGRDVRDVAEPIVEALRHHHRFYRLETITTGTRTAGAAARRSSSAWSTSGTSAWGPVYDKPREQLTREQVDASLRYQIMEVDRGDPMDPRVSAMSVSSTGC